MLDGVVVKTREDMDHFGEKEEGRLCTGNKNLKFYLHECIKNIFTRP